MSAGGYEAYFQNPTFGPGWMHKLWGQKFWKSVGKVLDQQNDLLREAQAVRTPDGAVAQNRGDALDEMGRDRMLPRGGSAPDAIDETDTAYAARLKEAWTTWGQDPDVGGGAGSVYGILNQLSVAGFPIEPTAPNYTTTGAFLVNHLGYMWQIRAGVLVMAQTANTCINRTLKDATLPASPIVGWTLDARDQFYSKWMLLFLEDVTSLTDDDTDVKARLNQICNRWKSGSAIYCGAAVVPSGALCIGWPLSLKIGDFTIGANDARFINPE